MPKPKLDMPKIINAITDAVNFHCPYCHEYMSIEMPCDEQIVERTIQCIICNQRTKLVREKLDINPLDNSA